jgi:hypothetical protein
MEDRYRQGIPNHLQAWPDQAHPYVKRVTKFLSDLTDGSENVGGRASITRPLCCISWSTWQAAQASS